MWTFTQRRALLQKRSCYGWLAFSSFNECFHDHELTLAELASQLPRLHPETTRALKQHLRPLFTFILCDLTRCMFNAGVLGRILPHPSTVQRMFVLTSLVSSVMVGLIISRDCDRDSPWHFWLSVAALSLLFPLPVAQAAMFLCWQSILSLAESPRSSIEWDVTCRPSALPERLPCHLPPRPERRRLGQLARVTSGFTILLPFSRIRVTVSVHEFPHVNHF